MSVSSIVMSDNPGVSRPKPASFSMTFHDEGTTRFVPSSETHSIVDSGWFFNATFNLEGPEDILNEMFSNGLGRDIKIYDELGLPAWEGVVTVYILKTSTTEQLVSLDNISNRQIIRLNVDGNTRAKTPAQNDVDSQNQYGIFKRVLHLTKTTNSRDNAANIKQVSEDNISDPYKMTEIRNVIDTSIPRGRAILSVGCSGYWFYLMHRVYNERTKNTRANISTIVANVIADKGDFVLTSKVETNTQQANQHYNDDEIAWDVLMELSGESDSNNNKYIIGMEEDRRFYYRARTSEALTNVRLTRDADGVVSDTREGIISPIRIVPDQYMRDTSIMSNPGTVYNPIRLDPQISYVERVVYRNDTDEAEIFSVRRTKRNKQLRKALQSALAEAT